MFIFKTSTTMKDYNKSHYWIDSDLVPEFTTSTCDLKSALEQFRTFVKEHYITISKTALKRKSPMYRDASNGTPRQCGYVFTASTTVENGQGALTNQYVDLWVEILTVIPTVF